MGISLATIGVLSKLLKVGVAIHDAWSNKGFDAKEISALSEVLGFVGEQGNKQREQDLAELHLAIITRCFGQALGRHWAYNEKLVPIQPGQKPRRLRLFMSKEEKQRAAEIDTRVEYAANTLQTLGDLPAGKEEWRLAESLTGSPLGTPYYKALWRAFSDLKLESPESEEPPLLDLGERGRMEFERHFLLAYYQALASDTGQRLKEYTLPQAGEEGASVAPEAVVSKEPKKERMPREDWAKLLRRTFALDVFTCAWCGEAGAGCWRT